jgi:predicted outer membrane repeat protein
MVDHGGALYISTAEVTISSSYFRDNVAAGDGYSGAAVYIVGGVMATISDSYFSNNTASGSGGAVYVNQGEWSRRSCLYS